MRKQLLLAAALGALAIMPTPASAHGHGPVLPGLGIQIIVRDGPKVVHHHHHAKRHLRPQPWPRHFGHHAPAWRWQGSAHHRGQGFHWRDRDHRPWFRSPGARHFKNGHGAHFKHGQGKHWSDAPWQRGRSSFRDHFAHDGFKHGRARSDRRRHRD
jgi:hypothetical protein